MHFDGQQTSEKPAGSPRRGPAAPARFPAQSWARRPPTKLLPRICLLLGLRSSSWGLQEQPNPGFPRRSPPPPAAVKAPRPRARPRHGPPPPTAARGPKDKEGGHAEGADAEDALDPAPHAAPALGPRCASFSRVPGPVPPPPGRRPRSPPPPPSRPGPQALGPVPPRPGPHTLLPGRGSARPPGPPPGRWRPSPRTREPAAEGAAGRRPGLLDSGTAALAAAVAAATILALSFLSFLQQQTGSASHGGSAATTLPPEPDAAHAPRSAHPAFPKVPRCPGSRRRRACAVDTASPRLAGGACGIPAFCFGARKPAAGLPLRHRLSVFCAGVSGVS